MNALKQANKNNLILLPSTFNKPIIYKVDICPAKEEIDLVQKQSHAATPFKKLSDIKKVSDYFISKSQYKNNALFIVGINVGLRCSDLTRIRVCDVVSPDGLIKDSFQLVEKKTEKTKGRKKNYIDLNALEDKTPEEIANILSKKLEQSPKSNKSPKIKTVYLNQACKEAITLLLNSKKFTYDEYLFKNESRNSTGKNVPMTRRGVDKVLKKAVEECGIVDVSASTHSLRKTFGYHWYMNNKQDPRAVRKLQKVFQHSSPNQTLDYIGITADEIVDGYNKLNLGLKK